MGFSIDHLEYLIHCQIALQNFPTDRIHNENKTTYGFFLWKKVSRANLTAYESIGCWNGSLKGRKKTYKWHLQPGIIVFFPDMNELVVDPLNLQCLHLQ